MLSEAAPKENGFILSHNITNDIFLLWFRNLKKYFGDNI